MMIKLRNVTVQISKKLFNAANNIIIRIHGQNQYMDYSCIYCTQNNLQMTHQINLLDTNKMNFNFEILQNEKIILHGLIAIQKNDTYGNWQIFQANNIKIGYLLGNIVYQNSYGEVIVPNKIIPMITLLSIYVYLKKPKYKRAYVILTIGNQEIRTNIGRFHLGELNISVQSSIKLSEQIKEYQFLKIQLYAIILNQTSTTTKLLNQIVQKIKISKLCPTHMQIQSEILNLKSQESTDYIGIVCIHYCNNQSQVQNLNKTELINLFRPYYNNLKKWTTSLSNENSQKKNKTNLYSNQNTVFSKDSRFKQCSAISPKVSYLPQQTLGMREFSNKYYKASSFGFGSKLKYKSIETPGVGNYYLPSIFNRY